MARYGVLCALFGVIVVGLGAVSAGAFATTNKGAKPAFVAASCRAGFKPAIIGGNFKCLKVGQRCLRRYQTAYRKYGLSCVNGRLRKRSSPPVSPTPVAEPPPPPTPPPAPPAQTGHYKGVTSQNETIDFDVTADGRSVTNLKTGQINQGCTPPFNLYGGRIDLGTYLMFISRDGSFGVEYSGTGTIGTAPAQGRASLTGHFSGPVAVGNLQRTTTFTNGGVAYSCGSGLQTWTATRTG
jgi:hypothetical protein